MQKPDYHFMVCASFRQSGEAQGVCAKKGSGSLMQYLENEIIDRGLNGMVTSTGCVKLCEKGPVMIVYPQGNWYGEMDEEKIDKILDAIEEDQTVPELLIQ